MAADQGETERLLNMVVDPMWYRARHRDVASSGVDPLRHFIESGLNEWRDPNRWFDSAWYARQYPDVAASGANPLLHYLTEGAVQGRDPHPRFDAGWYREQHPDAAGNPMLFHLRVGAARGWLTERPVAIEDYLPSTHRPLPDPDAVEVDVIIPVHGGLAITQCCVRSVLADTDRPAGRVIVVDDRSPEPKLSAWLARLAKSAKIVLLRNNKNLGFVASANLGMRQAAGHDVALLNSDTEVPSGWLRRLRAQAYAATDIATVSPLSNNATICSYLGYEGGPMPPGVALAEIDAACRTANAARSAATPTTVGFCMYIRRAALDAAGMFDTKTFGKGYGEENDFCLRATALGWRHRIACDTFVRHEGGASFGDTADAGTERAFTILTRRYPDYPSLIAGHVRDGENEPFRFAATMAMFRASGLPMVLAISHGQDGGVRRHVSDAVERDTGRANYLVLEPAARGLVLSVPALPGHPTLILASERWRDVAKIARSAGVARVHIHHLMGLDLDTRALIHDLGVPFDVTVHDYFAICPQVTLLPWPAGPYCGEPGPAGCDACIAQRPSHGATDILSWRLRWAWQFNQAEHVFAPSMDALIRSRRHGAGANATLRPHEAVTPGPWPIHAPARPVRRLRVAVLGILADHKGAQLVASVAMAAKLEVLLIGDTEPSFPPAARDKMTITGRYREGELPALLAKHRPHVIWFPAAWPETYSFTLSAAIDSGLPIVAHQIGAFPERLAGRPLTWLVRPMLDPAAWLTLFDTVADQLRARRPPRGDATIRPAVSIHAANTPVANTAATGTPVVASPAATPPARQHRSGLIDVRRPGTTALVTIPETFDDGSFTPCAHIRLLRPLDHPNTGHGVVVTLADPESASRYHADVIVTQRHAVPSIVAAEALAAHAKRTGAALIYDIDDDLLTIPPEHPDAAELAPQAAVVERMVRLADIVRTSTEQLAARVAPLARQVRIIANALDERIWIAGQRGQPDAYGPVRILCMGTTTHDADFAMIEPALTEIHRQFGGQIHIDLIGFTAAPELPAWIGRVTPPRHAMRSYPGFVHWITSTGHWDIGLAPLVDSAFNACKSAIKVLDYAALGMAVLASDVAAYRGSPADGTGGALVANTTSAWYEALSRLIRDAASRRHFAAAGFEHFHASETLAAQPDAIRRSWCATPVTRRTTVRR
jgi:GT2 family glycosyltransferase/glycosyltransferase involved in cell wall biosynthesis